MRRLPLLLCASMLLLACGGSSSGDGPSTNVTGVLWTGNIEGMPSTIEIGAEPSSAELTAVEAFRQRMGGDEVVYGRVVVDNTGGERANTARFFTLDVADPNGLFTFVCSYLARWLRLAPQATADDISAYDGANTAMGCANSATGPAIPPGETTIYYVAADKPLPQLTPPLIAGIGNEFKPA